MKASYIRPNKSQHNNSVSSFKLFLKRADWLENQLIAVLTTFITNYMILLYSRVALQEFPKLLHRLYIGFESLVLFISFDHFSCHWKSGKVHGLVVELLEQWKIRLSDGGFVLVLKTFSLDHNYTEVFVLSKWLARRQTRYFPIWLWYILPRKNLYLAPKKLCWCWPGAELELYWCRRY